jgi:glycosyltransferase involved in cell wall biosynthesis
MKNMKSNILNITQRYAPARGGAEQFIQILSEYLVETGRYNVDVWTTNALSAETLWDLDGDVIKEKEERINGIYVKRFSIGEGLLRNRYLNKIFRVIFGSLPLFRISNLATCPTSFGMLSEIKKDKRYDFVTVSSTPYYFLFYVGYLISKRLDIPLIVVPALHIGTGDRDPLRKKYFRKTVIPFFKHAHKIILNTKTEGDAIKDFCKENGVEIDEERFLIIGQGIFPEEIKGGSGDRFRKKHGIKNNIIFQIGSKSSEKGSLNLIKAMIKCWDVGIDATLVFGGGYNKEFSEYIEGLDSKYSKKILNIDNISELDKWDLYDAGTIFSMVSKTDSFGIVYLEAWMYGKPVLGCENDAIKEVISDGEDGYIIPFNDTEKISEKIIYLLSDSKQRLNMGANGRRKVLEKYNWDKNLEKVVKVYEK